MSTSDDFLAREADHRIANSLQLVAGLLRTQARNTSDVSAVSELLAASRRVDSIARVHERLCRDPRSGSVALRPYLESVCEDLIRIGSDAGKIRFAADELDVDAGDASDIGLVVTELVLNAMKHAVHDGRAVIDVESRVVGRTLAVTVSDDGPGLPSEAFEHTDGRGLGIRLVKRLADGLGADITLVPRPGGATWRLTMPVNTLSSAGSATTARWC